MSNSTTPVRSPKVSSPPSKQTDVTNDNGSLLAKARTIGLLTKDTVQIGDQKISADSEPSYDPQYERQTVQLKKHGKGVTNANDVKFASSIEWAGPVQKVAIYDKAGKILAEARLRGGMQVVPEMEIEVPAEMVTFYSSRK